MKKYFINDIGYIKVLHKKALKFKQMHPVEYPDKIRSKSLK
jgi:hypothetical protein